MVTILPLPMAGWSVELRPGEQPFLFPRKSQAISFAVGWAETSDQGCEVRLYGRFGELERSIAAPTGSYRHFPRSDRRQEKVAIPFPDRRRQERRQHI